MSVGFRGGAGLGWMLGRLRLDGGLVARSLPVLWLKQAWAGTTQVFSMVRIDLTDNGSSNLSNLLEVRRNNLPLINVYAQINSTTASAFRLWNPGFNDYTDIDRLQFRSNQGAGIQLSGTTLLLAGATISIGTNNDTFFVRDAANTVGWRNGTIGQRQNWYRTFTDSSNYERVSLDLSSNTFLFGPQAAGTGTSRPLYLRTGFTTVAGLSTTVGAGTTCHVIDAASTTPRSVAAGGGSNFCQVMFDGTNWLIVA